MIKQTPVQYYAKPVLQPQGHRQLGVIGGWGMVEGPLIGVQAASVYYAEIGR